MAEEVSPREFGALEAKVDHLERTVKEQSDKIDQLLALANQGRGSLRVLLFAAGATGGVVTWIAERFLTR